jgi:peptide/nickel transport system substrate-binding protein
MTNDVLRLALANGEVDFSDRLSTEDYFGALTESAAFQKRYYRGHFSLPVISYVAWNMGRQKLSDVRVRQALGQLFDWDDFLATYYGGLGFRASSTFFRGSPYYDPTVLPPAYDPPSARELLTSAGWYDRDGNGWVDKDGQDLTIEFLGQAKNPTFEAMSQRYQESLAQVGVQLHIVAQDFATVTARSDRGEFDAVALAWFLPPESDPFQLWHSSQSYATNRSGLADAEVDRLISAIQVELDEARRIELFHRLHRRIAALWPYNFGVNPDRKFAMSRALRGFQTFGLQPGYSIRRWYRVD